MLIGRHLEAVVKRKLAWSRLRLRYFEVQEINFRKIIAPFDCLHF